MSRSYHRISNPIIIDTSLAQTELWKIRQTMPAYHNYKIEGRGGRQDKPSKKCPVDIFRLGPGCRGVPAFGLVRLKLLAHSLAQKLPFLPCLDFFRSFSSRKKDIKKANDGGFQDFYISTTAFSVPRHHLPSSHNNPAPRLMAFSIC
jgi:hypothetical protein